MKRIKWGARAAATSLFLAAVGGCGGDSSKDTTPPEATLALTDIGVRDDIVVRFDESVDPESLIYHDGIAQLVGDAAWSETATPNDTLTLSPDGAWESGRHTLDISVADPAGNSVRGVGPVTIRLKLTNFQAASVVVGQPDFTSRAAHQGGAPGANTLNYTWDANYDPESDVFYVSEYFSSRVLGFHGIPTTNGASADFVIGQDDFTTVTSGTSATKLNSPQYVAVGSGRLFVGDNMNRRVAIFDPAPSGGGATIAAVIGQPDKTTSAVGPCDDSSFGAFPDAIAVTPDGKVLVQAGDQDRILVWNSIPSTDGVAANLVIGQPDFESCSANGGGSVSASGFDALGGMWTDGERLVVSDWANNRVLIWTTFPTATEAPADIVLGQPDFTTNTANNDPDTDPDVPSARSLNGPYGGVWSNGVQLFIADQGNSRVLIWNDFPTSSFQPADMVLGQSNFTNSRYNDDDQDGAQDATPSARTFYYPASVRAARDKVFVADPDNHRVLIFASN
jgi:hypothetical protein